MTTPTHYDFRTATMDDLPLLRQWLSYPHISTWWDNSEPYTWNDLDDHRVARWIVYASQKPFAYIQDYTVHGWPQHHFGHLPMGSRGIDQYIGEPDMLDLGHGTAFISKRVQTLIDAGAPVIATDPHPDNKRAIAVYRKIGFDVAGPPQETAWGLILPMHLNARTGR